MEDHPADIALTKKAFARLATPTVLHVALDGVEALQFLRKQGRYHDVDRPDLVLLDLNMPRMGGLEVLDQIDKDPALRCLPVIVLTTSSATADVCNAYKLCANSYVAKPVALQDFLDVVTAIESYWFKTALLPG